MMRDLDWGEAALLYAVRLVVFSLLGYWPLRLFLDRATEMTTMPGSRFCRSITTRPPR